MLKTKTVSTIKNTFSSTLNNKYDEQQTIYTDVNDVDLLEKKKIHYNAVDKLTSDPAILKSIIYDICIYSIKFHDNKPFIQFYLYNNKDSVDWITSKNFHQQTVNGLKTELNKKLKTEIEFRGAFINEDRHQLWFEDMSDILKPINAKYNDSYICCLVSEILNVKKYLNIDIADAVRFFFLDNPDFIYLYNEENQPYEIPEVGFYGNYYKKIGIVAAIGHMRETPEASLGSYYYFGSYKRAIRYSIRSSKLKPMKIDNEFITIDENGTYTRGGLVRFALFLGKTTVMLNRKTDKEDDSKISKTLAKKNPFLKASLKFRDSYGKWSENHDSVSVGYNVLKYIPFHSKSKKTQTIKLENQVVCKSFEQQLPLSYYYVDTSQEIRQDDYSMVVVE